MVKNKIKTLKKIKIWKWQAKAWMNVCHRAMELFPDVFRDKITPDENYFTKPEMAIERVIGLLEDLAHRRASEGQISVRIARLRPETGSKSVFSSTSAPLPIYPDNHTYWFTSLKTDSTTGTKICDGCYTVMQGTLDADSIRNWVVSHYAHRKGWNS